MTILLAMLSFSLIMSITPGPINMIILSSSINYGFKRTIPYVSGATIGFTFLLLLVGLLFFKFITRYPYFLSYLAIGGSAYIIYIAYKIAFSKVNLEINKQNIPKFYEGFLLQWVNPKAWIACLSGAALFSSEKSHEQFLTFAIIYFLVCYLSLSVWAVAGDKIAYVLKDHNRLRLFNFFMGAMLMITAIHLMYTAQGF